MKQVRRKTFVNGTDELINAFLSQLQAEDIVSTHFAIHGFQNGCDEWTTIFYKVEVQKTWTATNSNFE